MIKRKPTYSDLVKLNISKIIKLHITNIVIVTLLFVLFLQQCSSSGSTNPQVKRDTVWIHTDSTVYSKPTLIKTIPLPYKERSIEYLPDTNYSKLVKQYNKLVDKFLASNLYTDSLKIDSIGYVVVNDTISNNLLKNRSFVYSLKYPKIIERVSEKKRNQVYYGFNLGLGDNSIQNISAGALLKTKKDHIWGGAVGITADQKIIYSVQSYWKISFRKNK